MRSSSARRPSTSSASCSVSAMVWRTSTWSGISIGPVTFSWQAAACGNTAAIRSSASMRWIGGGLRLPLRNRSTISERLRFQRQRAWNIGESRIACCERVLDRRAAAGSAGTSASGKLWCGPSESTIASSVAAAWSSKLNVRQNRLRSASPSARLMRPPNGECTHELHAAGLVEEPLEHELLLRGHRAEHRARRPRGSRRPSSPASASMPAVVDEPRAGAVGVAGGEELVDARRAARDTSADSSAVRAGASPIQNGMVGGASPASRTRTTPASTGGSATSACRAGRCRPPSTRPPSLR